MNVLITTLPTINSDEDVVEYVASCPGDCVNDVDRSVYESVVFHGTTISMGCVIGEPTSEPADRREHLEVERVHDVLMSTIRTFKPGCSCHMLPDGVGPCGWCHDHNNRGL